MRALDRAWYVNAPLPSIASARLTLKFQIIPYEVRIRNQQRIAAEEQQRSAPRPTVVQPPPFIDRPTGTSPSSRSHPHRPTRTPGVVASSFLTRSRRRTTTACRGKAGTSASTSCEHIEWIAREKAKDAQFELDRQAWHLEQYFKDEGDLRREREATETLERERMAEASRRCGHHPLYVRPFAALALLMPHLT